MLRRAFTKAAVCSTAADPLMRMQTQTPSLKSTSIESPAGLSSATVTSANFTSLLLLLSSPSPLRLPLSLLLSFPLSLSLTLPLPLQICRSKRSQPTKVPRLIPWHWANARCDRPLQRKRRSTAHARDDSAEQSDFHSIFQTYKHLNTSTRPALQGSSPTVYDLATISANKRPKSQLQNQKTTTKPRPYP